VEQEHNFRNEDFEHVGLVPRFFVNPSLLSALSSRFTPDPVMGIIDPEGVAFIRLFHGQWMWS
jgi:hypothetical protein